MGPVAVRRFGVSPPNARGGTLPAPKPRALSKSGEFPKCSPHLPPAPQPYPPSTHPSPFPISAVLRNGITGYRSQKRGRAASQHTLHQQEQQHTLHTPSTQPPAPCGEDGGVPPAAVGAITRDLVRSRGLHVGELIVHPCPSLRLTPVLNSPWLTCQVHLLSSCPHAPPPMSNLPNFTTVSAGHRHNTERYGQESPLPRSGGQGCTHSGHEAETLRLPSHLFGGCQEQDQGGPVCRIRRKRGAASALDPPHPRVRICVWDARVGGAT